MRAVLLIALFVSSVSATIYMRDTFEDSILDGWTIQGIVQPMIDPPPNKWWPPYNESINPEFSRLQYHCAVSMSVEDFNPTEISNASHAFPDIPDPGVPEYIVEFYFHFLQGEDQDFNNFWLYKPTPLLGFSADIQLKVSWSSKWGAQLCVYDRDGEHWYPQFFRPDTTCEFDYGKATGIGPWEGLTIFPIERWYRIQIHKVHCDTVVLYVNGDTIGVYKSLSYSERPASFLVGTENYTDNGRGIFDDYIITTIPVGVHPRLFFHDSDIDSLRARRYDNSSTIPRTPKFYWDNIMYESWRWNKQTREFYVPGQNPLDFPYLDPGPDATLYLRDFWMTGGGEDRATRSAWLRYECISFRWLINELDGTHQPDTSYLNWCRKSMNSFVNWNTWRMPLETRPLLLFMRARLGQGIAMAYDLIFDSLSNYEKMSIQNGLITQGIEPGYQCFKFSTWGDPWIPPRYAQYIFNDAHSAGTIALVIDDDSIRKFYADFAEAIQESIFTGVAINNLTPFFDSTGAYLGGSIPYGGWEIANFVHFWEANRVSRNRNIYQLPSPYYDRFFYHPIHRLHLLCPGKNWDVPFGDICGGIWMGPWLHMYPYISNLLNSQGQWFFKRLYSYPLDFGEFESDQWTKVLPFITMDDELPTQRPEPFLLGYNHGNQWISFRTGWGVEDAMSVNDSNEVALAIEVLKRPGGHAHESRNNFVVGTNGAWVIDDYGEHQVHTGGWVAHSAHHNVIHVDSIWDPRPCPQSDPKFDNDYGQQRGHHDKPGIFRAFFSNNVYAYSASDAAVIPETAPTGVYIRMSKFLRKIVFTQDGFAVMKDEVRSEDGVAARKFLWLIHRRNNPSLIYGDSLIYIEDTLQIKFFSPAQRELVPFEVNTWGYGGVHDTSHTLGIYAANSTNAVQTEFLCVISPKRVNDPSWPPVIARLEGMGWMGEIAMLGARINSNWAVLYSTGQDQEIWYVEYPFNITEDTPAGVNNVLCDLKPDGYYNVYVDYQYYTYFYSSSAGTGNFYLYLDPGNHLIQVYALDPYFYMTAYGNSRKVQRDYDNGLHLAYTDTGSVTSSVYYRYSSNLGQSWITRKVDTGEYPAIGVGKNGKNISLAWLGLDKQSLLYAYRKDSVWSKTCSLRINSPSMVKASCPSLSFCADTVHIGCEVVQRLNGDEFQFSILYLKFPFDKPDEINQEIVDSWEKSLMSTKDIISPSIAIDFQNRPYLVWDRPTENKLSSPDVFYGFKENLTTADVSNSQWFKMNISNSPDSSLAPVIDCYGGSVTALWNEKTSSGSHLLRKIFYPGMKQWIITDTVHSTPNLLKSNTVRRNGFALWQEERQEKFNNPDTNIIFGRTWNALNKRWLPVERWSGDKNCLFPHEETFQDVDSTYFFGVWTGIRGASANLEQKLKTKPSKEIALPYYYLSLGDTTPFTIFRDGWMVTDSLRVDYGRDSLVYFLPVMDSTAKCKLVIEFYYKENSLTDDAVGSNNEDANTCWRVSLDVDNIMHRQLTLNPGQVNRIEDWVPAAVNQDGKARIKLSKISGDYVPCHRIVWYQYERIKTFRLAGRNGTQEREINEIPLRFFLSDAKPNPFNRQATIEYGLAHPSRVRIRAYDVTGRVVSVLRSEHQTAGIYQLHWDAKELASGVYFLELEAGEFLERRKSVLLK